VRSSDSTVLVIQPTVEVACKGHEKVGWMLLLHLLRNSVVEQVAADGKREAADGGIDSSACCSLPIHSRVASGAVPPRIDAAVLEEDVSTWAHQHCSVKQGSSVALQNTECDVDAAGSGELRKCVTAGPGIGSPSIRSCLGSLLRVSPVVAASENRTRCAPAFADSVIARSICSIFFAVSGPTRCTTSDAFIDWSSFSSFNSCPGSSGGMLPASLQALLPGALTVSYVNVVFLQCCIRTVRSVQYHEPNPGF